jgi:hypothetical protein
LNFNLAKQLSQALASGAFAHVQFLIVFLKNEKKKKGMWVFFLSIDKLSCGMLALGLLLRISDRNDGSG